VADCKFKTRMHGRRAQVVCLYALNDVFPPLVSMGCWGLVVSALCTSISSYGQLMGATLITKVGNQACFMGGGDAAQLVRCTPCLLRCCGWRVCGHLSGYMDWSLGGMCGSIFHHLAAGVGVSSSKLGEAYHWVANSMCSVHEHVLCVAHEHSVIPRSGLSLARWVLRMRALGDHNCGMQMPVRCLGTVDALAQGWAP